jgi:hypothetical protein
MNEDQNKEWADDDEELDTESSPDYAIIATKEGQEVDPNEPTTTEKKSARAIFLARKGINDDTQE